MDVCSSSKITLGFLVASLIQWVEKSIWQPTTAQAEMIELCKFHFMYSSTVRVLYKKIPENIV